MNWDGRVVRTATPGEPVGRAVRELLAEQRQQWRDLREGTEALGSMGTRQLSCGGAKVILQANPGRRASVHARLEPEAVAARPCFLCSQNMPPEERGVAVGDLVILPNPFPILRDHVSIPSRLHEPQRLAGRETHLLELAQALGPEMLVFYNGARCGASAPDHFHFQAGAHAGVPLVEECASQGEEVELVRRFGVRGILLRGEESAAVVERLRRILATLSGDVDGEPMVNVVALVRDGWHNLFVFPRARHRPACYFAEEPERISASPAALEMMGFLVLADVEHCARVDAESVRQIFAEVCADDSQIAALAEAIQ